MFYDKDYRLLVRRNVQIPVEENLNPCSFSIPRLSDVFRGHSSGTLFENGLRDISKLCPNFASNIKRL